MKIHRLTLAARSPGLRRKGALLLLAAVMVTGAIVVASAQGRSSASFQITFDGLTGAGGELSSASYSQPDGALARDFPSQTSASASYINETNSAFVAPSGPPLSVFWVIE
ncbi:MAG: hypothetical protein V2A74_06760 [bacterium]